MTEHTPLLQLDGLRRPAIGPVSLEVEAGECVCITGSSGTGKSQLLRAIADLDPHEGEVRLAGEPADSIPPHEWRRRIGLLPPDSSWWLPRVGDHFQDGTPPLSEVGLAEDILERPVARLSSGEKQRLAVLRLLAIRPRVLLLDEPTANLDPDNTRRIEAVITAYRDSGRAAVIWVSHDRAQVGRVCDRHFSAEDGVLHEREAEPAA